MPSASCTNFSPFQYSSAFSKGSTGNLQGMAQSPSSCFSSGNRHRYPKNNQQAHKAEEWVLLTLQMYRHSQHLVWRSVTDCGKCHSTARRRANKKKHSLIRQSPEPIVYECRTSFGLFGVGTGVFNIQGENEADLSDTEIPFLRCLHAAQQRATTATARLF